MKRVFEVDTICNVQTTPCSTPISGPWYLSLSGLFCLALRDFFHEQLYYHQFSQGYKRKKEDNIICDHLGPFGTIWTN